MTTPKSAHRFSATCNCCVSRRTFLASAAAVGATTLLPADDAAAQGAPGKLIDTHHHFYPPAYQKAWADWEDQRKIPHLGVQLSWTPAQDIEAMDKNGITTAVLSLPSTPGVCGSTVPPARPTTSRGCAAISPPRWCATIRAAMACSRRCR
jgi:hypothetical protein